MRIRLDPDVNALYISVSEGRIARTIELTESVYVDVDAQDDPLGIEFVNADEFLPFLRDHAGDDTLPPKVRELFRSTAA